MLLNLKQVNYVLAFGNVTFNFRSFPKRYTTSISDKIEYRLYS